MKSRTFLPLAGLSALVAASTCLSPARSAEDGMTLFKIVTVRDEIVVGVTRAEARRLDSDNAGAFARALKANGSVEVWRYAVGRGPNGTLVNAPLARIGVLAHDTLRVEPHTTPLPIAPPPERPD